MKQRFGVRWLYAAGLAAAGLAGVLLLSDSSPTTAAAADDDRTCYKLVKTDTVYDHRDDASDAGSRDWAKMHTVVVNDDGSITSTGSGVWRVWVKEGHAIATWPGKKGSLDVTWTPPPALWCSDPAMDFPLKITVKASDGCELWGGANFYDYPVERYIPGAVTGNNPWGQIHAGTYSAGFSPMDSGAIVVRPKPNSGDAKYVLGVRLDDYDSFYVHYHYEMLPKGEGPPPGAPAVPPTPPGPTAGGCPKTFAKVWSSPWGTFTFQVQGNQATGQYQNRPGKRGPGTVAGTVNGNVLEGRWKDPDGSGTVKWVMSDDGCSAAATMTADPPGGGQPNPPTLTDPGGSNPPPAGTNQPGGSNPPPPPPNPPGGAGNPWDTPEGQGCFEKWIALVTKLLNAYDGGADYNSRKPWSFNKYGLLQGGTAAGPMSAFAPDDFPQHGNNKYWWMWDYYNTDSRGQFINEQMMNKVGAPPLRDYVRQCSPASTPAPPEGMILQAPDLIVPKGAVVLVPVQLINAKDVLGMDFELAYLPDIAAAQPDAEKGSVETDIFEYKLNQPGLFRFNFAQLAPFAGQGTVCGFRFNAVGPGRSRTPLTLSVHRVDGPNGAKLPITVINGSITIYDPTDLTDPNNPNNPNPPGGTGTSQRQPTCSGTGRQTVNDAQCCLKMWVGLTPKSLVMDLNNDNDVDSADALIVLQNVARDLAR